MVTWAIFLCFASQAGGGLRLDFSNFIESQKFDSGRIIMPQNHKSYFPLTHYGRCSGSSIPWGFRLLKMPIRFQVFHHGHDIEKHEMHPSGRDAYDPATKSNVFQCRIRVTT
jgi:hypothetical protein